MDVKQVRLDLGLTQAEWARKLRITAICVSRWENNKSKPSRAALKRIQRLSRKLAK